MKNINQTCAVYLKELLEAGASQVSAPEELELLDVSVQQPLAQDSATVRIAVRNKQTRYVNELYVDVDLS